MKLGSNALDWIDRYFEIGDRDSTMGREVVGGLTTFATMSYIVFVQPTILSLAGMPFGSVLVATCLSSALGCFLMGALARYPFALAPGMGTNFLFTFTVCGAMGFSWGAGLAIVFIAGLLFVLLSFVGGREKLMEVLPDCLKNAIGPAIGLFISFVGLQWSGIIVLNSGTMVSLGGFHGGPPLICVAGLIVTVGLMARGFGGAILVGLIVTGALGMVSGVLSVPTDAYEPSFDTFFSLDFSALAARWQDAVMAIALFFFLDLFDTVGTLVGVSKQAGLMRSDGTLPRSSKAFLSDAIATCVGALFGTSTVTTYIESSTGIAAGARTGLAAIVTGVCFLLAIAIGPIIRIAGQDVGPDYYASLGIEGAFVGMYPTVAPAMIVVGMLMMAPLRDVKWADVTEAFPAFLTIIMMAFGFGITEGVAMGCISYALVKTMAGRYREVHPIMYAVAAVLILRYAYLR